MNLIFYLAFNLIVYSFIGWIIEELYSYFVTRELKKDAFLIGPLKPMYGIACSLLVWCNEVLKIDGIPIMMLCFLIPTTVEYISGYILKHVFNKVYWDYSKFKYNIHGYVTLRFSLYWMLLSFVAIYSLQSFLYNTYMLRQDFFNITTIAGIIVLIIDFYLTLKRLQYEKTKVIQ